MRYYIIAGEASGDLHGSNLVRELKKLDPHAEIRGWGGDLMQAAGVSIVRHIRDLAFMGFSEVLMNLRTILNNLSFCKQDILSFKPDTLILIDYPGFNLRIAKWAKAQNLKVIFYISPQVWAWKENRVKMMKETIDRMLVILPFEKEYFKNKWQWDVEYVGHPLVQVIENFKSSQQGARLSEKPVIALLPGSRKQEITKKLPVMLEVSKSFPGYQFIVAEAPAIDPGFYEKFTAEYKNVSTVKNRTYELLCQSAAALVTSGTATLETALFGVPEVVCYKGSAVSYQIAKRVIKVKYISLVNLIMDRLVVKELIQQELTPAHLETELAAILQDEKTKETLRKDYAELKALLTQGGNASEKAARSIMNFLSQ
jgi:lipid-A-disaccharide synthase